MIVCLQVLWSWELWEGLLLCGVARVGGGAESPILGQHLLCPCRVLMASTRTWIWLNGNNAGGTWPSSEMLPWTQRLSVHGRGAPTPDPEERPRRICTRGHSGMGGCLQDCTVAVTLRDTPGPILSPPPVLPGVAGSPASQNQPEITETHSTSGPCAILPGRRRRSGSPPCAVGCPLPTPAPLGWQMGPPSQSGAKRVQGSGCQGPAEGEPEG